MHARTSNFSAEIGQPAGRKTLHQCTITRLIRESKRRFTAIHTTVCFRRHDTGVSKRATRRCHLTPPRRTCLLPCTNQHLFPPLLERQRGGLRQRSRVLEKTSHLAVLEAVLNERSTSNITKMRTRFGRDRRATATQKKSYHDHKMNTKLTIFGRPRGAPVRRTRATADTPPGRMRPRGWTRGCRRRGFTPQCRQLSHPPEHGNSYVHPHRHPLKLAFTATPGIFETQQVEREKD